MAFVKKNKKNIKTNQNKKTNTIIREKYSNLEYNKDTGKLIKEIKFHEDDMRIESIHEYDKNGEGIIKQTFYDNNEKIWQIREYDSKTGNIIKTMYFLPDGTVESISEYNPVTGKEIKCTFPNSHKKLIQKKNYNKDDKTTYTNKEKEVIKKVKNLLKEIE